MKKYIASLILILLTSPVWAQNTGQENEIWLFFGRFHPLIVHLPIGFILLAFLMELVAKLPRFHHLRSSTGFVLGLGIISAFGAALLGYFLSLSGEYQGSTVFWHQWLGIATFVFAGIAYLLKFKKLEQAYLGSLFASVICLSLTGHLGGNLTHGSDYLTRYMPDPLKSLAGIPTEEENQRPPIEDINEALLYADLVKPLMEAKCESCHNADKTKGKLRLDSPEGFLKGGENGEVLMPGSPEESELFKRVNLPKDHEDVMPPDGKKPLTASEKALLEWWISNEASFDKKVKEVEKSEDIAEILQEIASPKVKWQNPAYAIQVSAASTEQEQQLVEAGFSVSHLAADSPFLQVSYLQSGKPIGKEQISALEKVSDQVTWLNLGHVTLAEGLDFSFLEKFPHLSQLSLQRTSITDEELQYLQKMQYLEYLNLYGTQISEKGIAPLKKLEFLTKIYLWQTEVEGA
ncbi:hypothetical protein GCM10007049_39050 [Echinicola pacifica]|uniref:Planctomycete cytochrome C n=1 Tax=Echinicola pacifica TaxID=346377 RepID=A0A918QE51_9BACT|nr:c-type cytochrome domain-containing protein [Echinicola pacifica]GGZ42020.1 hypothetical protein GCM10007049_39050 [Echinicola pacifica]